MKTPLYFIVALTSLIAVASSSNFFVATPQIYRAGDETSVFVSVDKVGIKSTVTVDFSYDDVHGMRRSNVVTDDFIADKDTGSAIKHLKFPVPFAAANGKGKVTVACSEGMDKLMEVQIRRSEDHILIQTDKPVYKPGGKVRFRVVMLDKDLKPAKKILSLVYVVNPAGSRIMQWTNVTLLNGIASLEMPISIKPVLGEWKISATYQESSKVQVINVDQYVLPKFEVTVKTPPYLLRTMKSVPITVCAKYTYGKQVAGVLYSKICLVNGHVLHKKGFSKYCTSISKKIDGCTDISYDISYDTPFGNFHLSIDASVTESATGINANASHTTKPFQRFPIKLRFIAPKYYKPGFKYKVQLFASTPDGRPTVSEYISLIISNNNGYRNESIILVKNGLHEFHVYPSFSSTYYSYTAKHLVNRGKPIKQKISIQASAYEKSNLWFSVEKQYVDIVKMENLEAGKTAKFSIRFSESATTIGKSLKYLLVCKSKIMVADQVKIDTFHLHVHIPVTYDMLPTCRMLIYYVSDNGEFVADSKKIEFKMSYRNKASVIFSESESKPGEQINLILRASPESQFALSTVDRSVQLLGKTSDLKEKQILDVLSSQDIQGSRVQRPKCKSGRTQRRCRWFRCYYVTDDRADGLKAIEETGLQYNSNAIVDLLPCPFKKRKRYGGWWSRSSRLRFRSRLRYISRRRGASSRVKGEVNKKNNSKEKATSKTSKQNEKAPVKIRTEFPETWLWLEESISSNGEKILNVKVPDTITTWYANGFAISPEDGIGIAAPASLKAFQPFFVSMALPYSVIRGESVKIPVTIFNYLDDCLVIQLNLKESPQFKIKGSSITKTCICGSKSKSYKFIINPEMLGKIDITAMATSLAPDTAVCGSDVVIADGVTAADAMTRKLLVEAEGIKKEISANTFFCPRDHDGIFRDTFVLFAAQPIVPGSLYAELSVVGDMMGPSMDNIDKLLAMPFGCGEQNMVKFAPNIYIMDYLTATNQVTDTAKNKAIIYLRSGYQRELTYKHNDGAYSAFGKGVGSTWLTAFVLRSYAQAKRYIFIDPKDIEDSKRWLLGLQEPSGCFKEVGMVHSRSLKGGVKTGITMTAFVLNALLEAGVSRSNQRIQNALRCINNGLNNVTDSYTASILAYSLTLAGSDKRWKMLDLLKTMEKRNDAVIHWEAKKSKRDYSLFTCYFRAPSADIEMTAYALLSHIGGMKVFGEPSEHLKIARWLITQRNSYGGFSSTQDTIVALMALSQYSILTFSEDYALDISTSAPGFSKMFKVTSDNKLLLQKTQIPSIPVNISIEATGRGCALVQASVKYNIPDPTEDPSFFLKVDVKDDRSFTCKHTMKVCGSYTGNGKSNMALIDVTMVSGFEPMSNELDISMQSANIAFSYYEFQDGVLSFYFDEFDATSKCVVFSMEQVAEVSDREPATVKIYDYYNTDQSATMKYEVGNCPEVNAV